MSTPHFTPEGAEWVRQQHYDALLLAAADALAAWLHRDDVDKHGKPLIGHCRRVAATLREQGWSVEVQAAGFLHDAIEDAPAGEKGARYEMMETALSDRVAELVAAISRKKDQPYREYIETLAHPFNDEARAIKLADLRDNLDESRGPIKESLRKRYALAVERLEKVELS